MTFVKTATTQKDFQRRVECFLIRAMCEYGMAEVAKANGYLDYSQDWQGEFERTLFIDLNFFISSVTTKTAFDRRRTIDEIITEYNSTKSFLVSLLTARKALAARYVKRPHADLKLPDVVPSRNAFWLMVSEAAKFALEEL